MNGELSILLISAASIGFVHTLFGPDHYLPFVAMSKSRNWSLKKTALITILCGVGHVGSSVLLGFVGIGFSIAVSKLISIETFRGNIAAWLLIAFGFIYFIWGVRQAIRNKPHTHFNALGKEIRHSHNHSHNEGDTQIHKREEKKDLSPWVLFTIFVFGPCEPLIPILIYPASQDSLFGLIMVILVFGVVTICTMVGIVLLLGYGLEFVMVEKYEKFSHALAGGTIFLSGIAIQFLGL